MLGYEEQREKILRKLRGGYPRFVLHPATGRLFSEGKSKALRGGVIFVHRKMAPPYTTIVPEVMVRVIIVHT